MEARSPREGQVIEISVDVQRGEKITGGSKACGEAPCELSDATANSQAAEERYASMRKLFIVVALCIVFMTVEIVGGIYANSLAILTDAAHLLSDVASFAISLFSLWAAGWEATPRQSYGFFRVEILGALVSMQLIWLLTGILVYEAILRLIKGTTEVNGFLMFVVAAFGLLVNISMTVLLGHDHGHDHHDHGHGHVVHSHGVTITGHDPHHHHHGEEHLHEEHSNEHHHHDEEHGSEHHHKEHGIEHLHNEDHHHVDNAEHSKPLLDEGKNVPEKKKKNINMQGAYLHALGDSIQSVGVMIAGGIIWYKPEWKIVDLICTLIFSVIVLVTTIRMLRSILEVLMESTPREIDATKLQIGLLEMEEVVAIHELHIWAITVGKVLLACHVKIRPEADADMVLDNVINYIKREYNISHVTIQIER